MISATLLGCGSEAPATPANDQIELLPPPTSSWVLDAAGVLGDAEELEINQANQSLFETTGDALYVITLASLDGETIEDTGLAYGRGWGVGDADLDNGVLLLSAIEERQVRIEVGYGLEGLLTDVAAKRIIEHDIVPVMRSGDIGRGHVEGAKSIGELLRADIERPRYRSETREAVAQ